MDGLEQVSTCPGLQSLRQCLVVVEGGQHDRQGLPHRLAQVVHHLDPGTVRKLKVHEHDVGADQLGTAYRLSAAAGLSDDVEVVCTINDLSNAAPDDLVVVHDHDADLLG